MKSYKNTTGKESGVTGYEAGPDYITVRFSNNVIYKYTHTSAGKATIETMRRLAIRQAGLSTFISQHDPAYEQKS